MRSSLGSSLSSSLASRIVWLIRKEAAVNMCCLLLPPGFVNHQCGDVLNTEPVGPWVKENYDFVFLILFASWCVPALRH